MTNIQAIEKLLADNGWHKVLSGYNITIYHSEKCKFAAYINDYFSICGLLTSGIEIQLNKHRLTSLKSIERSIKRIK